MKKPIQAETEKALDFLMLRNPFDHMPQTDFFFLLLDYVKNKGDESLQALAGFYVYVVDNVEEEKQHHALVTTFSHDLSNRFDTTVLPRSIGYHSHWLKELERTQVRS